MGKYFGTDGVRGRYGLSLFDDFAYRIGKCLGGKGKGEAPHILLGRDTRESGKPLAEALSRGIVESGGFVHDLGVTTTPSLSYLVREKKMDFAVMISASHNPYFDNGIKVFGPEGKKIPEQLEAEIEAYMDLTVVPAGNNEGAILDAGEWKKDYVAWLQSKVSGGLSSLHMVADLSNGSATAVAKDLFAALGANVDFIADEPDGRNINENCGSTHVEALKARVLKGHYDLGLAFDGDADRFIGVTHDGRILDGDAQIFLSALSMKSEGKLRKNEVVLTSMSNLGLRKALEKNGISYQTVGVGDKYVQAALEASDLSLGGEQSGHVIYLEDLNTGDGLLSALKMILIFAQKIETAKRLSEFVVYPQVLKNVRFADKIEATKVLENPAVSHCIEEESAILGDSGRVFVRASGTEPLIRVMVEADDIKKCEVAVERICSTICEVH